MKSDKDESLNHLLNEDIEYIDMCVLSSEQKLHVINTLLNGILLQYDNHQLLAEVALKYKTIFFSKLTKMKNFNMTNLNNKKNLGFFY